MGREEVNETVVLGSVCIFLRQGGGPLLYVYMHTLIIPASTTCFEGSSKKLGKWNAGDGMGPKKFLYIDE